MELGTRGWELEGEQTKEAALLEPGAGREQACWAHKGQNCSSVGVPPR